MSWTRIIAWTDSLAERDSSSYWPRHATLVGMVFALMTVACAPTQQGDFGPQRGIGLDAGATLVDGGDDPPGFGPSDCTLLREKTCGATCGASAACKAAELMSQHASDDCSEALNNPVTFPRCTLNSCESLMEKTCGDAAELQDAPCATDPGCILAQRFAARLQDDEATQQNDEQTLSSCLQALEDELVFYPCSAD